MNVSANLLEYLKKNDSAELIGIGTFRVSYTHASMSPITNTLTPPSRSITFVNELNDDLSFVQSMAKNEFISVDTAIKWVKQYSDSVKERIELSNICKLGDLGTLSKGIGKGYTFVPQEGLNLLDSAFAFSTLKSVKTFDQGDYIQPIITKEPIVEEPIIEHKVEEPIQRVVLGTSSNVDIKTDEEININEQNRERTFEKEENNEVNNSLNIEQTESKDIVFEERKAIERDPSQFEQAQKEVEERLKKDGEKDDYEDEGKDEFDYKNSKKFRKEAKAIKEKNKKEKKAKRKRNRVLWKVLFIIVLLALLSFGALVFAHYMCWLKGNKTLEPITLRLNNFIIPKCDRVAEKTVIIPVATPTVQVVETPTTEIETPTTEAPEVKLTAEQKEKQKIAAHDRKIAKEKAKKEADKLKPTGEKDNPPVPTAQIDYTTPITVQSVSRLGFDVVGGTFGDISNAQQASRKARSMGYDSYIVSKIKNDKPIYYVSYGSRRSMKEASDFMKKISKRSGDSGFYIISR